MKAWGGVRAVLEWLAVPAIVAFLALMALSSCSNQVDRARVNDRTFYNATIAPQFTRSAVRPDVPVVRAGVPTVLRFGIGPRWETSDLSPVQPNPAITESAGDVPLTVLVACSFCDAPRSFQGNFVYRSRDQESNVIEFPFVPSVSKTGDGWLEISVFDDRSGAEYDRIVLDVAVSSAAGLDPVQGNLVMPFRGARAKGPASREPASIGPESVAEPWADVIMDVAADSTGAGVVTVRVTPLQAGLQIMLASHAKGTDGRWRTFRTGLVDQPEIERITSRAYGDVTALVLQGEFLRALRRVGQGVDLPKDVQEGKALSDQQLAEASRVFGKYGQNLHAALFEEGEDGASLAPVIATLERAARAMPPERPLRLLVRTARVALPWQYLHPSGSIDPESFWGMRFSLAVQRVNTGRRERTSTVQDGRAVVFLKYATVSDPTVMSGYADRQIGQIKAIAPEPLVIDSRRALLSAFRDRRKEISAVITFLHASAGRKLELAGDSVRIVERITGPEIEFSPGDAVDTATLENLNSALRMDERPVLAAGPLVFLNACETGPSTVALPHVKLEDAMFRLGARGVIVTEVAVWVPFGHEFATRLLARLGKGERVGDAVTQVRREMLQERKNPFTLLYAYYGDHTLRLPRQ
jgi:hypothetical protein